MDAVNGNNGLRVCGVRRTAKGEFHAVVTPVLDSKRPSMRYWQRAFTKVQGKPVTAERVQAYHSDRLFTSLLNHVDQGSTELILVYAIQSQIIKVIDPKSRL